MLGAIFALGLNLPETFMHYDVIIIGASMSGLAAGIRLAYFDRRVCIVEKHYAYGGLNSYYTLDGRAFDVGLHAVTNFVPKGVRNAPLPKLLRQLRLTREDFDLRPQKHSEIRFPNHTLKFSNDIDLLIQQVAQQFPAEIDRFQKLVQTIREYDDTNLDAPYRSARNILQESLGDKVLVEMLLCPLMYYGSAEEHDMDFTQFVTMFKAVLLEGFARPKDGVRTIAKALVKKFRECGGKLRMRTAVEKINIEDGRVSSLLLSNGETATADVVFSSAGYHETMRLTDAPPPVDPSDPIGRVSFVESIAVLDRPPTTFDHDAAIVFFNDDEKFTYAVPDGLVDLRSGVFCCPNNYEDHEDMTDGMVRLTWLASYDRWAALADDDYETAKQTLLDSFYSRASQWIPQVRDHVVCTDMFTPRTIERFTGHINGAVYGAPNKRRDGCTPLKNLFVCGTDQGFLGIIGAMLSGITVANLHVLSK